MPEFDVKIPDDLAPVYDSKGMLLGVAPYQHLASWNFCLGVKLGLWDAPSGVDREIVNGARSMVQSRPLSRLLTTLGTLPDTKRLDLMKEAAETIGLSTGHELSFDLAQASSPWLFWFTDRLFGITSDHKAVFGLRANHSNMGTACLQPTGNGYRNTDSTGTPLSPEANGLLEMKQEFGLDGTSAVPYGIDRTMKILQFYNMAGKGGEVRHPGVVITYAVTSATKLGDTADAVLRRASLNHENLGAIALDLDQLERLATGQNVAAQIVWSKAFEAKLLFSQAQKELSPGLSLLEALRLSACTPASATCPGAAPK